MTPCLPTFQAETEARLSESVAPMFSVSCNTSKGGGQSPSDEGACKAHLSRARAESHLSWFGPGPLAIGRNLSQKQAPWKGYPHE